VALSRAEAVSTGIVSIVLDGRPMLPTIRNDLIATAPATASMIATGTVIAFLYPVIGIPALALFSVIFSSQFAESAAQDGMTAGGYFLPGMLSAGVLPAELVTKVAAWRRAHGGELLVGTRFGNQMDDWPALHYARSLLETDDLDHYLLLMYSHWAHHCSQGTLSSYEQVRIEPDDTGTRRMVAGQVVPCQVMVPTMLRWGLVYEERDADVLWLCRAIPRRWLAPDQEINIRRVPTRFGRVGFTIRLQTATEAKVTLRLPDEPLQAEIRLRLRHPQGLGLSEAMRDEQPVGIDGDLVRLPAGLRGKVKLILRWS